MLTDENDMNLLFSFEGFITFKKYNGIFVFFLKSQAVFTMCLKNVRSFSAEKRTYLSKKFE